MGTFNNLLKGSPGARSFLVTVNDIGEIVIERFDADGRSVGFTVGYSGRPAVDRLVEEICPGSSVIYKPEENEYMVYQFCPHGARLSTWAGVAAELNRKPMRVAGVRLEVAMRIGDRFDNARCEWVHGWARQYVDFVHQEWVVTEKGKAYDQKFYPPEEANGKRRG